MTGSSTPGLDSLVLQWQTNNRERALAMLSGHQALMDQLKAEIARLEDTSGQRRLLEHDEISRQLHRVLKAIQAAAGNELPNRSRVGIFVSDTNTAIDGTPVA